MDRPEFQRLHGLGLASKPAGRSIGFNESHKVWRASCADSPYFGRFFDGASGRSAWQALLRVMELMLDAYVQKNSKDKLAKKHLARIRELCGRERARPD